MPLGRHLVAVAILLTAILGLATTAGAAQVPTPVATCDTGGPFAFGVGIDCTIAFDPPLDPDQVYSGGLVDQNGEYWPCDLEAERLECRGIGKERYDLASRRLDLELDHQVEGFLTFADVAEIETTLDQQSTLYTFIDGNEPVVFDGRPLPIELFAIGELDRTFIVVRDRRTGDLIESIEVSAPGRDRSVSTRLAIDAPPGRYRIWPCVGADADACEPQPAGFAVQVIDPEIAELIPGHNRPSAERINMVFAGSNLGSADDLVDVATAMLTLGGPAAGPYDMNFGPMAIEPLASNAHKFNFWYLVDPLADERSLLVDGTDPTALAGFDLDNMAVTVLYGPGYGASDARLTSMWNLINAPAADQLRFGGARVSVDLDDPLARAATLAHEWGHSLFELRDEYVGFDDRAVLTQYPNCAPTAELADDWWGSLDGTIDPFVYEVLRARRAAGFPGEPREGSNLATSVRIGVHPGGCYDTADANTAFRPSSDSLMNSEIPVWGAVNRRRVEQVLARFSGRGPLDDLDAIELACERQSGTVDCAGTLDRYLDPPDRRVALDGRSCTLAPPVEASSTGEEGRATIQCSAPSTAGPVTLVLGDQERSITVVDLPDPEPVTPPEIVGEPSTESSSNGSRTTLVVWSGVMMLFLLVSTSVRVWRRQK